MSKSYSASSKKREHTGSIVMLIACLLIVAVIGYIIYGNLMSKSAFLTDSNLSTALSEIFDKSPRAVSKADVASIKYLQNSTDSSGNAVLYVGFDDFVKQFEAKDTEKAQKAIKSATLSSDISKIADLKYFTGVKYLYLSLSANITDFSIFDNMKQLDSLSLSNAGIKDFTTSYQNCHVNELVFA